MTATTSSSPLDHGRPFTVDDLEAMPDDGNRYELIDGELHVSPAPGLRHQKVVQKLSAVLDACCPDDMHVLPAPFAVRPSGTLELQPDVVVARASDLTEKLLPVAPLLAVEVLSASSTINDFNNKKAIYERMGVPSYWVVDPHEPALTVFELDVGGRYLLVGKAERSAPITVSRPFPVRVVPVELLGTLAGGGQRERS